MNNYSRFREYGKMFFKIIVLILELCLVVFLAYKITTYLCNWSSNNLKSQIYYSEKKEAEKKEEKKQTIDNEENNKDVEESTEKGIDISQNVMLNDDTRGYLYEKANYDMQNYIMSVIESESIEPDDIYIEISSDQYQYYQDPNTLLHNIVILYQVDIGESFNLLVHGEYDYQDEEFLLVGMEFIESEDY